MGESLDDGVKRAVGPMAQAYLLRAWACILPDFRIEPSGNPD